MKNFLVWYIVVFTTNRSYTYLNCSEKQARKGFWPISVSHIFWEFLGKGLRIFWEFFWNFLGILLEFFGIFWEFSRNFYDIFWNVWLGGLFWIFLDFWEFIGISLETLWEFFGNSIRILLEFIWNLKLHTDTKMWMWHELMQFLT